MSPDKDTPTNDLAVFGFCELVGLILGFPPGDDLYKGSPVSVRMCVFFGVAAFFAVLGPSWPVVKKKFGRRLSATFVRTATNFRYWLAVMLVGFLYAFGPDIYQRAAFVPVAALQTKTVEKPSIASQAIPQNVNPLTMEPDFTTKGTKLTLIFTGNGAPPTEQESHNIHWSYWNALEDIGFSLLFGEQKSSDILGRNASVRDTMLIFLAFDHPVKYDDFRLSMADGTAVPKWEKYQATDHTAIIWIHEAIKQNIALTIEPITVTESPAK